MLSNKLRGLYFIVGESQFLSHDFDNILSKSLDLGLNLLQYRFDSENFFIEHEEKILNAIDKVKSYESILLTLSIAFSIFSSCSIKKFSLLNLYCKRFKPRSKDFDKILSKS